MLEYERSKAIKARISQTRFVELKWDPGKPSLGLSDSRKSATLLKTSLVHLRIARLQGAIMCHISMVYS